MEAKIGQKITATDDFEIQGCFGEDKIQVKKGDRGFIDSNGFVHYETGKARGKMQRFDDITVKGYDTENITNLIYEHISKRFNLDEFLEDYEYEEKDLKDEIDYILSEIL